MRHWILFTFLLLLSALGRAQERIAEVLLDDGRQLTGRVVTMDLKQLQLVVGEEIVTLDAEHIKSCRFRPVPGSDPAPAPATEPAPAPAPAAEPAAPAATPAPAPDPAAAPAGDPAAAPAAEVAQEPAPSPAAEPAASAENEAPAETAPATEPAAPAAAQPAPAQAQRPAPEVVLEVAPAAPTHHGLFGLLERRLESVEATYPWLYPTSTAQRFSIALLVFSLLSLIIHCSASIAGAENMHFGRSLGLALIYFVGIGAQLSFVPVNDFTVFTMLIGNTAVTLFLMSGSYGLPRVNAFISLAVQVGFAALTIATLQLIDSLLGSVAAAA